MKGDLFMKRFMKIMAMPLVNLALVPAITTLFAMHEMATSISFINPLAIICYVLAGFLFSRIDSKKDKIISTIITLVLTIAMGVVIAVVMDEYDMGVYYGLFTMPISMALFSLFGFSLYSTFIIIFLAPVSTLISVISGLVFSIGDKKKRKIGSIIVLAITAIAVIGFVISGIITQHNIRKDSYLGDDGAYYSAYFDMNGNKYENQEDVPYYDRQGNVYHWTYDNDKNADYEDDIYDYVGEITASDGTQYSWEIVYIDTDGYLYIDEKDELELRDDIPDDEVTEWDYEDKNGMHYSGILVVEYDRDGTPYVGIGNQYK